MPAISCLHLNNACFLLEISLNIHFYMLFSAVLLLHPFKLRYNNNLVKGSIYTARTIGKVLQNVVKSSRN